MADADEDLLDASHVGGRIEVDRYLTFGVAFEVGVGVELDVVLKSFDDPVREVEAERQQAPRLVAGVAVHDALIPGALRFAASDACGDLGRLRSDKRQDLRDGVVQLLRDAAGDPFVVHAGGGRDFTSKDDDVVLDECLDGDVAVLVALQAGPEDGVADLVGVLVGVVFAHLFCAE